MHHNVHSNLIHNSQKLEITQVSFSRRMDAKMWYIYTMDYYLAIRNNAFTKLLGKWMELETHSE